MKKISISTTQNVTIEYELANLSQRMLAFLLDSLVIAVAIITISYLIETNSSELTKNILYYLIVIPIYGFYTLGFEILNHGQTIGKMAVHIRVVKLTGKQPENFDYFIRWVFRPIDITLTLGTLAMILISSTEKAQRLGGFVSNTTVIKLEPAVQLTLPRIMKINSIADYKPKYPTVRRLRESDMLTIKMSLDRYLKFKNSAHEVLLDKVLQVIYQETGLKPEDGNKIEFIKTLIQDYIVLTR